MVGGCGCNRNIQGCSDVLTLFLSTVLIIWFVSESFLILTFFGKYVAVQARLARLTYILSLRNPDLLWLGA